jgi:hypothetical protein
MMMRHIELKLKKKGEQLKIKEAILNDSTSEKTKLLDRLFKAETRNLELENKALLSSLKSEESNKKETTGRKTLSNLLLFCCGA